MRPMPMFKIRCSMIHAIMGRIGLTENQEQTLSDLLSKPKLTEKQQATLSDLEQKKANPDLPDTLTSYLKKWYAEKVFNYRDEQRSKYTEKGNWMEADALDLVSGHLDWYGVEKNDVYFENEWLQGTPDYIHKPTSTTLDTKCSWDGKTHLDHVMSPVSPVYWWQGQGYMDLTGSKSHIVAHVLLDTIEDLNYGVAIEFDATPRERIHIKQFDFDQSAIDRVYDRVQVCRDWLERYDFAVRKAM